jgi:hypothetical protein
MTTLNVPRGAPNRINGREGRIYSTRVGKDGAVVDMMSEDFEHLLHGPDGNSWTKANPDVAFRLMAPEKCLVLFVRRYRVPNW